MISREDSLRITAENYPRGPEELADRLNVEVSSTLLVGVDGWCIRGEKTIIRVNSGASVHRQRFTLAHELAHLILGTEPDIAIEPFHSDRDEEREADQLASQFLIPDEKLSQHLSGKLPIDARALTRLAKSAKVSPVMAACRVVNMTEHLGLKNAAVVFFVEGSEKWRFSKGLHFSEEDACSLLQTALACKPELVRKVNQDGNIIVGSIIEAPAFQVLFVQLLSENDASNETYEEQLHALGDQLFGDNFSFRQSVAARLGSIKSSCAGKSLNEACEHFVHHYVDKRYKGSERESLESPVGQQYVRLFLQKWFS